jgi:CheY-specific phosphatase CheX
VNWSVLWGRPMPETIIPKVLQMAANEVLETMFFLGAMQVDDGATGANVLRVALTFDGDPPGRLLLRIPRETAAALAANFLGEDPCAVSEQQVAEVAGELSNMICGAVLSRIEGTTTFRLATPQFLSADPPVSASAQTVHLDIGEGPITITFETGAPICPATEKSAS